MPSVNIMHLKPVVTSPHPCSHATGRDSEIRTSIHFGAKSKIVISFPLLCGLLPQRQEFTFLQSPSPSSRRHITSQFNTNTGLIFAPNCGMSSKHLPGNSGPTHNNKHCPACDDLPRANGSGTVMYRPRSQPIRAVVVSERLGYVALVPGTWRTGWHTPPSITRIVWQESGAAARCSWDSRCRLALALEGDHFSRV